MTEWLRNFDYKEYLVQTYAEKDRVGRLMTWLVNPQKWVTTIVKIISTNGERVYTQHEINRVFAPQDSSIIKKFLEPLPLKSIDLEDREKLGGPREVSEIKTAVKKMAQVKVPGIDGLLVAFYATNEGQLEA